VTAQPIVLSPCYSYKQREIYAQSGCMRDAVDSGSKELVRLACALHLPAPAFARSAHPYTT